MPHPEDDWFDLPEYPVRPPARRRPVGYVARRRTVWEEHPLGSRLGAVLIVSLLAWPLVAAVRSGASGGKRADAATGLIVDATAGSADGGLAADTTADPTLPAASAGLAEGTVPATLTTLAPATAPVTVARKSSAVSKAAAVVKPASATTKAPAKTTTTAKAVVKPTTATTKATTAPATAVVKPPATATTPRTTRPQATTTTEPAPAPTRTWTTDEVQALIQQMWPADSVDKALQVAFRESRFHADVYNGWCCYGVFQINGASHQARLAAKGYTIQDLYDPRVNIEIALELFNEQGWGPWGG